MSAVIARGMAKAPEDRFASAGELAAEAHAALAGRGVPRAPAALRRAGSTRRPRMRARRRWAAALAGASALIVAAVVVAVILTGSTPPTVRTTSSAAAGPASFPGGARFSGNGFTFAYPAGWAVVENQRDLGAFVRTKVVAPDGQQLVIVDRVPSDTMTPKTRAISVSQSTGQRTSDYQLRALAPVTLGTRAAFIWSFTFTGQPLPARYDVFQRLGTSGYAVLAEGPVPAEVSTLALTVARSLEGS
jgi:hypothetical protein